MSAISSPLSSTSFNSSSVVSGLEDALMTSIGQGMQAGGSTNSGALQQEMQLLTELLNQSDGGGTSSSPATGSNPLTASSNPFTDAAGTSNPLGDPSASGDPSATASPSATSTPSATRDPSTTSTDASGKPSDPSSTRDDRADKRSDAKRGSDPTASSDPKDNSAVQTSDQSLQTALERNLTDRFHDGQSPTNSNSMQQEMNLLIELLGQKA